jgi:transcriptional regulator with GAF, ATPase, and Fis domain
MKQESLERTLWSIERRLIEVALRAASTVTRAAEALHEDRANLYRRMRRLGIPLKK